MSIFRLPRFDLKLHQGHFPVGLDGQSHEQEQLHLQAHGLAQTQEHRFIEALKKSFPILP